MSDIQHIGGRTPDLTEENVDKLVALFPDSCNGVMRTFLEIRKKNLTYEVDQLVSGSSDEKIKLIRAQGGCPGTKRR